MLALLLALACSAPPEIRAAPPTPSPVPPTPVATPSAPTSPPPRRVVAIGDLHADPAAARAALRLAGLIDDHDAWTGGDTVLVQTGDVNDRGPDGPGVMRLLRDLTAAAPKTGGRVVALLGNHEVMNVQGDWRYVNPTEITAFGGEDARKAAFSASGEWGAYLAGLDAVAVIGDTLFCHGGLTPAFADRGVDKINRDVRAALFAPGKAPVIDDTGPLWYRGYAQDDEAVVCPTLERTLAMTHTRRMVVGHTTQQDGRVHTRCNGRVVMIDTGISAHYGSHAAVWESLSGDSRAVYPGGPEDLPEP